MRPRLTSIFARSRFDPKFGTVYINKVHPDYSRKVLKAKTELEQLDYYYKLAIKEIVLTSMMEPHGRAGEVARPATCDGKSPTLALRQCEEKRLVEVAIWE